MKNGAFQKKGIPAAKDGLKRVGIWIRVSTEDQAKGESPINHEKRAREYAKVFGWEVVELYDLSGVSGKTVMEHPEARRMLADIRSGHINALLFSKLARLARNTRELLDLADIFRDCSADMVSIQERIDTSTPAGRLFYTLIAALSQWEREEIADRVKSAMNMRAKRGLSLGGAAPFGYQWKSDKLVVEPVEGPVRKLMYELFAKEQRRKSVARILNARGYRTRKGAKFTDTTVVRLIQDPTAKGWYRANHTFRDERGKLKTRDKSEWVLTPVEPLVSEELWAQCNAILAERKNGRPLGPKPTQMFAGLIHCGCGERMYVFSRSPKYVCPKCRTKIPIDDMENIFREELKNFFISKEKVKAHLVKTDQALSAKRNQIDSHRRQLDKLQGEMEKLYHLYQSEQISAEGFGKLYRPLETQEQNLSEELPKLEGELAASETRRTSVEAVVSEAANLYQRWPTLSREEKQSVVSSVLEKVVVSKNAVTLNLCYTTSSEPLTKRQRNLSGSWRPPT